jgi:hypothetical protein
VELTVSRVIRFGKPLARLSYGLSVEDVQVRDRAKERASTRMMHVEAYGEHKTMAGQSLRRALP